MPRAQNFFYQDPTADIGNSLVRAIFGDPQAAQAREAARQQADVRAAQAERERAAAGYDVARTGGVTRQNTASDSLPGVLATLSAAMQPPPPPVTVSSPQFSAFDTPLAAPAARPDLGAAVAGLTGTMGQMNGEHIDPAQIMGILTSMLGNDEMTRRGMMAQGKSPTADHATTSERADEIAGNGFAADLAKALGVATINNRDDIPVANIQRGSAFDVATVNNRDDVSMARIAATSRENVAAGSAPGFDAITRALPGATMNSGLRTAERNAQVGGSANSYHLGTHPSAQGYDIPQQSGMTIQQARSRIEAANPGVRVVEALDEGDHWHFALQGSGGASRAAAANARPLAVSAAAQASLNKEIRDRFDGDVSAFTPAGLNNFRRRVTEAYQQSGNIPGAVELVFQEFRRNGEQRAASTAGPAVRAAPASRGSFGPMTVTD